MIPTFCCPQTGPTLTLTRGRRLRFDLAPGEVHQLYAAVLAYYDDPTAQPLDRNDSTATADLNRAACALYIALRNNTKSAL